MDEREIPTLDEIKHKLETLKTLDDNFKIFGAIKHQYISYPLSNDEIVDLEGKLGVRLPKDYRTFLQAIGYGAGPYYGLFSPNEILSSLFEWDHGGASPTWPPKPGQPFTISPEYIQECIRKKNEPWVNFQVNWPENGCIPICHEGCGGWYYLVTAGELLGNVVSRGILESTPYYSVEEDWMLVPQPIGSGLFHSGEPMWGKGVSHLPTFLDWYNAWLDRCLSDLKVMQIYQEIIDSVERGGRINLQQEDQRWSSILSTLSTCNPEEIFWGCILVFQKSNAYSQQQYAANILDKLEPKIKPNDMFDLGEILRLVIDNWNVGVKLFPIFLARLYGRDTVLRELSIMEKESLPLRHRKIGTMIWWLTGQ